MISDWKQEIAIAWLVKQAMSELDKEGIFPYHMPEVAAYEEEISRVERQLCYPLDDGFKGFLRCANGWRAFWHSADLFGTNDLLAGDRKNIGDFLLSMLPDAVISTAGFSRTDLLPICATNLDKDLFVIARPSSVLPGTVIWFAGEEIERFATFDDYFLAMVEYGRQDVNWLKQRATARSSPSSRP